MTEPMRLFLHLVRKDVRYLRLWIVLCWGAFAATWLWIPFVRDFRHFGSPTAI